MKPRTFSLHLTCWLLAVACFAPRPAAAQLNIYIVTDLEGASGVYQFAQTSEPGTPPGEKAKEYLMGDIAAVLYRFDETRQALYEGARRAVAAIPRCKPYELSLPIQAKKEHLVFDGPSGQGRLVSKEGTIEDVLKLLDF
jgi:hypothetical protein